MTRRILNRIGSLTTGIVVGVLFYWIYSQTESQPVTAQSVQTTPATDKYPLPSSVTSQHVEALEEELNHYREWTFQLENQVIELESRLSVLEEAVTASATEPSLVVTPETGDTAKGPSDSSPKPDGILSISTLVESGIDPQLAVEIVNRKNDFDMRQLELRDQAIRDGTFGTEEYFKALRELNDDAPVIRSEIGENAYDRYLYATGQPNRVVVTSVIQESPAELAGIQDGDIILDYDGKRIFAWSELRDATSEGERGEYIRLTIQRKTERISLLLPRGPIGVRMGNKTIDPLID